MKRDNEPNQGRKLEDPHYLRKYDDPSNDPTLQLFTQEDFEDRNKVEREYHCVMFKSSLDILEGTETIWICSNCSQMYYTIVYRTYR